jgi:hypothetical protein
MLSQALFCMSFYGSLLLNNVIMSSHEQDMIFTTLLHANLVGQSILRSLFTCRIGPSTFSDKSELKDSFLPYFKQSHACLIN